MVTISENDPEQNIGLNCTPNRQHGMELKSQKNEDFHEHEDEEEKYPEGGRGWLVVMGAGLGSFTGFGMVNCYGAFQTHYKNNLYPEVSSIQLSMIGACQASILYFCYPLFIPLVYAMGIRQMLIAGCSLMIVGMFGLSTATADSIWKCYFFQGILYSLGIALVFTGVLKCPSEWFKKRRATALGITFACVSLGGVIWPIIFKNMINKHGFKWTVRTMAFLYIPISIAIVLLVPQRLKPEYIHESQTVSNSRWSNEKIEKLPKAYIKLFKDWSSVAKDWRFILVLLSNVLGAFGIYPAIFYLDFFGNLISPGTTVAAYLVVIYNALGGPGRIIPAMLADRYGRANVLFIWMFLSGVSVLAFWIPSIPKQSMDIYLAFVVLFGFFAGPFFSLMPAVIGQLFSTEGAAPRFGLYLITTTPGPLLGCLIAGSFIPVDSSDKQLVIDSFYKLTIYSGVVLIASSLILLFVRLSISRKFFAFV